MKREMLHTAVLAWASACGVAGLIAVTLQWPELMTDSAHSLIRYVFIRLISVLLAIPVLTGLMVAVDYVTPGDWMKAIGNDPKASASIMASVVLVIGAILCWA